MSIGSWFRTHRKAVITHTSIMVAFVLFIILAAGPLFNRLESVEGESRLHRISLPNATTNIIYSIYYLMVQPESILADGWAFIYGQDANDSRIYLVLKSDTRTYVFGTGNKKCPTITQHFEATFNLNLDDSGFIANIPLREIEDGHYTIGIYIRKGNIEALSYTGRNVIKSEDSVVTS